MKSSSHLIPYIKKAEATLSKDGQIFSVSKGAPQVILSLAKVSEEEMKKVNAQIENFATKGFRTLGVAKQLEGTWTFLGLISLFDPPREDTKQTIYQAKRAIFEYIEGFYNRKRLHSTLGYMPPEVFEEQYYEQWLCS